MPDVVAPPRLVIIVEGDSDAGAVRKLARRLHIDVETNGIAIQSAHGVTNFPRLLAVIARDHPDAPVCGLYDIAEERHVRRALRQRGIAVDTDEHLATHGFYACVDDLEDERTRARGVAAVEQVRDGQGELVSFRRLQQMPHHRGSPVDRQLHRFLGTRATRKVRLAALLVDAIELDRLPHPLAALASRMLETGTQPDQ
jgi:hypothetical protein